MTCGPRPCSRDVELAATQSRKLPVTAVARQRAITWPRPALARPCGGQYAPWRAERLWPQFSIAHPENLTGEAVAMVAEQVRDDVCDLVGCTWPVDFERHSVDGDVALTQL
jgi:hypothetical protein